MGVKNFCKNCNEVERLNGSSKENILNKKVKIKWEIDKIQRSTGV